MGDSLGESAAMSLNYKAVGWNRQKKIYDGVLVGGVALYLLVFIVCTAMTQPAVTAETILIRAFGLLVPLMAYSS